jgi:hypothetical protein
LAWTLHQLLEERELPIGQVDGSTFKLGTSRARVESNAADIKRGEVTIPCTQRCTHARQKLVERERLRQ